MRCNVLVSLRQPNCAGVSSSRSETRKRYSILFYRIRAASSSFNKPSGVFGATIQSHLVDSGSVSNTAPYKLSEISYSGRYILDIPSWTDCATLDESYCNMLIRAQVCHILSKETPKKKVTCPHRRSSGNNSHLCTQKRKTNKVAPLEMILSDANDKSQIRCAAWTSALNTQLR
jgi:hypothetical protein